MCEIAAVLLSPFLLHMIILKQTNVKVYFQSNIKTLPVYNTV